MSRKFDVADCLTIESVELLYEKQGIASVVTDGKYVQVDKEEQ